MPLNSEPNEHALFPEGVTLPRDLIAHMGNYVYERLSSAQIIELVRTGKSEEETDFLIKENLSQDFKDAMLYVIDNYTTTAQIKAWHTALTTFFSVPDSDPHTGSVLSEKMNDEAPDHAIDAITKYFSTDQEIDGNVIKLWADALEIDTELFQ